MTTILSLSGIEKQFGKNHILHGVDLEIREGEILSMLGPSGCGKTTSARILARTLNCEKAPVADPCGECQSCRDLARGGSGSVDVIEIDAASHGGVDDARDLRERAFFAPVSSRFKIYIVDEAHMVTTAGFNALLKLVEEPPPHVVFMMATTELEKVPPTIQSRSQVFELKTIGVKPIADQLQKIADAEHIQLDAAALTLLARAGDGSMRDAQSKLDQVIAFTGKTITGEDVATVLGLAAFWLAPFKTGIAGLTLAILALCISRGNSTAARWAFYICALGWFVGCTLAVIMDRNPLDI